MCNRFRVSPGQYAKLVELGIAPPFPPDEDWRAPPNPFDGIDIWPKYRAPIVHRVDGELTATFMRWGFPTKIKGASGKVLEKHVTNCRNYNSPFWKSAIAAPTRRCLVPFSEFAEPKPGKDEAGKPANYWFSLPASPIGMFAGIWRPTDAGDVFAFLTCDPNPLVGEVHPKAMPVVLEQGDWAGWLDEPAEEALCLAAPFPSQLMIRR